jgi:hypothetical protein
MLTSPVELTGEDNRSSGSGDDVSWVWAMGSNFHVLILAVPCEYHVYNAFD